jgi:cytochrome c oxidase cbb3-type subunit 4
MYESLAHFAQTWGLVLFVVAFGLVLAYALNPAAKAKFDDAKNIPLKEED